MFLHLRLSRDRDTLTLFLPGGWVWVGGAGGRACIAAACGCQRAAAPALLPHLTPTTLSPRNPIPRSVPELEAEMRRVGLLGAASTFFPFESLDAAGKAVWSLVTHASYMDAALSFAGGQAQGTPESLLNVTYMRTKRDK